MRGERGIPERVRLTVVSDAVGDKDLNRTHVVGEERRERRELRGEREVVLCCQQLDSTAGAEEDERLSSLLRSSN